VKRQIDAAPKERKNVVVAAETVEPVKFKSNPQRA
jgi:hypothetical protein